MARILIVDDSAYARHRLSHVLQTEGHEVFEADGGVKALGMLEEVRPDLVTVDLLMPEMDGIELIRRIKAVRPDLPVVAVSADVQKASQEEALAAGAAVFISKTAAPADLLDFVRGIPKKEKSFLLSLRQKEAFTEFINIAMGQAASALSTLMEKPVQLRVPRLDIFDVQELAVL